jgi:hypothetical protein
MLSAFWNIWHLGRSIFGLLAAAFLVSILLLRLRADFFLDLLQVLLFLIVIVIRAAFFFVVLLILVLVQCLLIMICAKTHRTVVPFWEPRTPIVQGS